MRKNRYSKRKKVCLIACLLVLWVHLFISPILADVVATVAWVFDGNTIRLSNGARVRNAGINAPEIAHEGQPAQPFAGEAYMFNKRELRGFAPIGILEYWNIGMMGSATAWRHSMMD